MMALTEHELDVIRNLTEAIAANTKALHEGTITRRDDSKNVCSAIHKAADTMAEVVRER